MGCSGKSGDRVKPSFCNNLVRLLLGKDIPRRMTLGSIGEAFDIDEKISLGTRMGLIIPKMEKYIF